MAWSSTPSIVFGTNYSASSTTMTLSLSDFSEITAAEANALTGDSRKIVYGLIEGLFNRVNALPLADAPTKMSVTRSRGLNADGTINASYVVNFTLEADNIDVAAE